MQNKIVFLILHYKVIEETTKCINSILEKYENENYEIVVVDNGSNNGTGKKLQEIYNPFSQIHIIINKENMGFAKGNNIGFDFSKKIGANYIVMANNDIIFTQENFCKLIIEKYEKCNYAILGPKIVLPKGDNMCYNAKIKNIKQQYIFILLLYIRLFLAYIHLEKLFEILLEKRNKKRKNNINLDVTKENIPVHGSCIIFSKNYIDKFNGIDDRTFLYCEEDLLYLRAIKNNLKIMYEPSLEILHNHSVSTKSTLKDKRKREIFVTKNLIKSNKILLEELKNLN